MNKINPFFHIGTVGMLFTAIFHILMATFSEGAHASFSIMYPVFIGFLIVGTSIMIKKKKPLKA